MKVKPVKYTDEQFNDTKLKYWDENSTRLFYNFSEVIRQRRQFWNEELNNRYRNRLISQGKLLPNSLRAKLKDLLKYDPIEPNIVSTVLQNLTDNVYRAHFHGRIKAIMNIENSIDAATMDLLIKGLKTQIGFEDKLRELVKVAVSEGFYPFLKINVLDSDVGAGRIELQVYSSDSTLPDMRVYQSGSDVEDIILIDHIKNDDLYILYDDKKDIIDEYLSQYNEDYVSSVSNRQVMIGREDFQQRFDQLKISPSGTSLSNRDYACRYTWLRSVVVDCACFVDTETSNEIIITPDWTEDDILFFQDTNPTYALVNRTRNVIWETAMTDRGIILRNRMHPIQIPTTDRRVSLPGVCYVPNIISGKVEAFTDVIAHDLQNLALTATFAHDAMFMSGGKTLISERGTFDEATSDEVIRQQLSARFGHLITTEGGVSGGRFRVDVQTPNTSLLEYYNILNDRIKEYTGINQEMQGRTQASSSNYRTSMNIRQALSSKSAYINNLNKCDENLTNILLYLFCMTTTNQEVFIITDDAGTEEMVEVNQISQDKAGRIIRVMNDLRQGKFRYFIAQQNSSALNDDIEAEAMQEFMMANGSTILNLMQGDMKKAAMMFNTMPYAKIREMGEALENQMDAQADEAGLDGAPPMEDGEMPEGGALPPDEQMADGNVPVGAEDIDPNTNPQQYDDYINAQLGINAGMVA
ncbi:MAG: hypothetical protein FWE23_08875 [Chitinivibrionia bacterium]|nr:hypothetical protein [Chitinivibrionia bacterium]